MAGNHSRNSRVWQRPAWPGSFFISKLNCLNETVVDKKVLEHYFPHWGFSARPKQVQQWRLVNTLMQKRMGKQQKRKERKSENKHKNTAERKSQTIQTNLKNVAWTWAPNRPTQAWKRCSLQSRGLFWIRCSQQHNRVLVLWQRWIEVHPVCCSWEKPLCCRVLEGPWFTGGTEELERGCCQQPWQR